MEHFWSQFDYALPIVGRQSILWNVLFGLVTILVSRILYNLYLHPLAKYPGPSLYAATPIPIALAQLRGHWHIVAKEIHDQYGPVVRLAPNELSFISAESWQDIYARRAGDPPLPRDRTYFNDMLVEPQTMTMMNDEDHSRLRRALAPAFSPRALIEQEPILNTCVNLLVERLQDHARDGLSTDLRVWYNYATFDLLGELAFGESFGCLATSRCHEWVQMLLDYFYTATLLHVVHRFSPLNKILALLLPASLMEKKQKHTEMAIEKIHRRTAQRATERKDFVDHLVKAVDEGVITASELDSQATILILAGSETTSVALTFASYFLMTHRTVYEKLNAELRENFESEDDIDLQSVNRLKYLHAVLQETLRCRPPITNGFGRQTPKDGVIVDGQVLPRGVVVNINQWAAYQSAENFAKPNEFIPERWLGDPRFKNDNKGVFQPFSVGPRNCIGKKFAYDSMKLILSRMLWRFDMKLAHTNDSTDWSARSPAFTSFHLPPLDVFLEIKA